ncbi:MAG: CRISPR-associated protein Cas4 [bacterium]|nr:CRISPR-associated protein Cas4 [bacterium]
MGPIGPISFSEDALLPLSALQHLVFCPRQCALIYLEGVWDDNQCTVEGNILHAHVHELGSETRGSTRIARQVPLRSFALGLAGVADCVAFTRSGGRIVAAFPVEYKRGKPKLHRADEVQLCAQALCLEEMLAIPVPNGALFYGQIRRRHPVEFNETLRALTRHAALRLHELFDARVTPPATYDKKCRFCSLRSRCMPRVTSGCSALSYLSHARRS